MFWKRENILSTPYSEGETEALQTDIQRFIAIIGFCLMAVFALVQAIPVIGPEEESQIEDLKQKLEIQKAEIGRLEAANQRLKAELKKLLENEVALKSLEEQLKKAQQALEQQKGEIDRLRQVKVESEKDLVAYKKQLEQRDRTIEQLKDAKVRIEKLLKKARDMLKISKPEDEESEDKTPEPPEPQGITVAFESDDVFLDLLGSEKIYLFIWIKDTETGFRVLRRDHEIDFRRERVKKELDFWEIKETMVPDQIIEMFRSWTTLSTREKMFSVGLTSGISDQIRGRKAVSGKFTIKQGGNVSFNRF